MQAINSGSQYIYSELGQYSVWSLVDNCWCREKRAHDSRESSDTWCEKYGRSELQWRVRRKSSWNWQNMPPRILQPGWQWSKWGVVRWQWRGNVDVQDGMVWNGMVRYSMVWYGMVWCGNTTVVLYGMAGHGMAWWDMAIWWWTCAHPRKRLEASSPLLLGCAKTSQFFYFSSGHFSRTGPCQSLSLIILIPASYYHCHLRCCQLFWWWNGHF